MNISQQKEEARIRKQDAIKVPILNQDFLLQKHLVKKDMVIHENLTICIPVLLMIPQIQPEEEPAAWYGSETCCMDDISPMGSCQSSETRCSGS